MVVTFALITTQHSKKLADQTAVTRGGGQTSTTNSPGFVRDRPHLVSSDGYQAGVYEALTEAGLDPDWIAGISIGVINGALIAGNALKTRVDRLRAFWERVTAKPYCDWSERLFPARATPRGSGLTRFRSRSSHTPPNRSTRNGADTA